MKRVYRYLGCGMGMRRAVIADSRTARSARVIGATTKRRFLSRTVLLGGVGVAGRQRAGGLELLLQQLVLAQARLRHDLPAVVRGLAAAAAHFAAHVLP